ncbi:MAG: hypothetical protein ACI9OJ_002921, partial [Myxococcota bacterium]
MPFEHAAATPAAKTSKPEVAPAPAKRANGSTYAEGAAALSPNKKPGLTPKEEKARAEAAKAKYESLLGGFLGGKLYEAVSKELSAEKLLGHGTKGVDG